MLVADTPFIDKKSIFMNDIFNLDLSMIKMKLQDAEEGKGWTPQFCDEVEIEYKRFLALKRIFPDKDIVPNKYVDAFWHQHILDTQKYAEDCEALFGSFIHHYPYFGMRDEEDRQNLINAFEETKQLYFEVFSEPYEGEASKCKRTACKPQKCR